MLTAEPVGLYGASARIGGRTSAARFRSRCPKREQQFLPTPAFEAEPDRRGWLIIPPSPFSLTAALVEKRGRQFIVLRGGGKAACFIFTKRPAGLTGTGELADHLRRAIRGAKSLVTHVSIEQRMPERSRIPWPIFAAPSPCSRGLLFHDQSPSCPTGPEGCSRTRVLSAAPGADRAGRRRTYTNRSDCATGAHGATKLSGDHMTSASFPTAARFKIERHPVCGRRLIWRQRRRHRRLGRAVGRDPLSRPLDGHARSRFRARHGRQLLTSSL